MFLRRIGKFEQYVCRILLITFVCLLFLQVVLRVAFNTGVPQLEELSRFAFVWFVFLGASYAASLGAHNRVTIHLDLLPRRLHDLILLIADLVWVSFNIIFIVKSLEVIGVLLEFTFESPALEWSMAYVYLILPLGFGLMTLHVIQVRLLRLIKGVDPEDVDHQEVEKAAHLVADTPIRTDADTTKKGG